VDVERVQRWTAAYTAQFGLMQTREQIIANAREVCDLQNYIIARVRERQAQRREDMISDLIYARLDDEDNPTLTYGETVSLARALLIGGNDTIATALSNLLFVVATDPEIAAQFYACAADDLRLARFIEELLRIEPPVRALSRLTTKEVELGGKLLPAEAHLLLLYASANDDDKVFACPRSFDMNRKNIGRHMSFGAGIHLCVGMAAARMELKVAAREIAKRLENIKLAIPVEDIRYLPTVATLTMESLPLTFGRRR
jgi:cytochrome P450